LARRRRGHQRGGNAAWYPGAPLDSFGYSACPDLADQAKVFALLGPEKAIDVTLTSAYQLVPEASTSAIVVHHPAATYYLVKV
jgi:cobalamin-dependent methionine synthase I